MKKVSKINLSFCRKFLILNFLFFFVFFLPLFITSAYALNEKNPLPWAATDSETSIDGLRLYEIDNFRIFYYTKGHDAIDRTDKDKNKIADYVEDVARQFVASQYVFCEILGFPRPSETMYYKGIETVDVYIVSRESLNGVLGMAFSQPEHALLKDKEKFAVKILISKGFKFTHSSTITHEYFHIIQNGMSLIKNKWYFEGLARWAENLILKKDHNRDPRWDYYRLIKAPDVLKHVQAMSYDAGKFFWIPLSFQFGQNTNYDLPENCPVLSMKYSDGTSVVQDTSIRGGRLIKLFLEELHKMDQEVIKSKNLTVWDNAQATSMTNNSYIMKAIKNTLKIYNKK